MESVANRLLNKVSDRLAIEYVSLIDDFLVVNKDKSTMLIDKYNLIWFTYLDLNP